jgi:hypothetical protein
VNCCPESFAASPGWDAATGLGTPNFNTISNLVINNATAFPNLGAYPNGVSSSTTIYSTNDDDTADVAEDTAIAGVVIACVSFVLALTSVISIFFCSKSSGGLLNNMVK